jgi:hypothetical protein
MICCMVPIHTVTHTDRRTKNAQDIYANCKQLMMPEGVA